MKVWVDLLVYLLSSFFFDKIPTWQILAFSSLLLSWKEGHVQPGKDEVEDLDLYRCSVPNSSDGPIFEKRRATDGHFFNKNTGVKTGKIQVLVFKKARKFDSRLFSWLHWLGRASKFKLMRRNHLLKVHSLVAT